MSTQPRRDLGKEWYWRRLLRQWRGSRLTGREFCVQHGLSEPSFYAWRREIARRDQERITATHKKRTSRQAASSRIGRPAGSVPDASAVRPAFVKLAVDAGGVLPSTIDVVVGAGRLLRVRPGFDADLLRQLVHVLEEPSC
jgi:hypothetical protein